MLLQQYCSEGKKDHTLNNAPKDQTSLYLKDLILHISYHGKCLELIFIVILVIYSAGEKATNSSRSQSPDEGWYRSLLSEEDAKIIEHSGKMVLLFEILRMSEDLEDKV